MTSNLPATTAPKQPKSILMAVATRYQMEPEAFERTLRGTVFPGNGTREEFAAFLVVAERYKLDPITRQIYAFPKKGGGIVPVVGIDGWIHLVNQHPQMNGMEFDYESDEKGVPISCTCRIFRKDRSMPTVVTEFLDECIRPTDPWKMKRRMLRHKALMQCARYAFGFSGLYDEDEAHDIANSSDAPLPPAPPPPPRGAIAERDAGTVEDAVIVEQASPATSSSVSEKVGEVQNSDDAAEDEIEFDFDPWIETVRDAFGSCQSESDVDEAHNEFKETVENILGSEQRMTYQEIHEEALTRVTSPAEEEAPAAPPPPAVTKRTEPETKAAPDALAMDDDEPEQPELSPGAAYIARGDAVIADPKVTGEAINAFWLDTKDERAALKKDAAVSTEDLAELNGRLRAKAEALKGTQAGGKKQDETKDGAGPEMSDLDKRVAAFSAEFAKRMNEIESMTELNSYFASTLGTRNGFSLDLKDPRVVAWKSLKAERTAAINAAS